jgi:ATP-dependent helicase/DNAse subunit B
VPLRLVTGPANAEKARVVLDAYAAAVQAGRLPLLVVPTAADVAVYRRELAGRGIVFGASVLTGAGLQDELARRAQVHVRALGPIARERVAALAAARAPLGVLRAAAGTPGFAAALAGLEDELTALRVDPPRWHAALRAWAAADPAREGYATDLAALHRAYRAGLDAVGRPDEAARAVAAIDVLRREPGRWDGTPVFVYGFDDLTRIQLDMIEALALQVGAPVTVSLPYEPGREAFAGRATTYQELAALGAEREELPAVSAHYAAPALHHLERALFEAEPGARPDPGDAVVLLAGGGERAELELVGTHVAGLLRAGVPPGEIAVVLRRPEARGPLLERVFGAYGIPYALERRVPAGHTALGRGLLALLSCALLDGTPDDLLTWLRTPGLLHNPALADDLEVRVRQEGARTAADARALWTHFPLDAIDRVARAHAEGPRALCDRLAREAAGLLTAPWAQTGAILDGEEAADARVARELRGALGELGALARRDPALVPAPAELHRVLGALEVRLGSRPRADAVTVADPLAIRARRVRVLVACTLQEGVFPAPAPPEPFLGDAERRAINTASGLRLALHEDRLGAERHLFYAAASRPTEQLVLAWHTADDDGRPQIRSPFVDDVLDVLAPELAERTLVRELGAAGADDPRRAATAREAARAAAAAAEDAEDEVIAPLRDPLVLGPLAEREAWSASALETWVACPVRWFVERHLRPQELVPDPEPLVRGELAHAVLERVLGERAAALDRPVPLREADVPAVREAARTALAELADGYKLSVDPQRLRAALHRLEADLLGYLEWACRSGSAYAPARFEVRFGGSDDPLPAVDVGGGLALQGRIDRVDVAGDGTALVYDYKGKTAAPQAKWLTEGRLQLALYLRALPHLLGLQAAGGLYQPLGTDEDRRPRGALLEGRDPDLRAVDSDRVAPEELEALLDGALAQALTAAAELRAGRLEPRPATCGWRDGGCTHPSICRGGGL